ncbi:MAG: serine/threonine-protein kinase [Terriglobales bacterium]
MATMFDRFEVQSEISKSETSFLYKALDCKSNQTVALKTQSLKPLGDRANAFVQTLIAEGERTRDLTSQNIVVLYGAGEIDGQFCAAMEYIQGNSIATMLARKEGFSIWDLLDISRQVCAALTCADALDVVHSSLEPAKIMVQWDGLVKILGYGISNMSLIQAEAGNGLGPLMPYCSPEQIRGEAIDQRSNLFTLGTILYEMVAGRKAFSAEDPVALVKQVEHEMPASPASLNPKAHPAVSAVIMKALAKDPAERYQTARALVEDLEQCKETSKKAAAGPSKTASAAAVKIDPGARAAAAAKFVSAASASERPTVPASATASPSVSPQAVSPLSTSAPPVPVPQAMKAAAGASSDAGTLANDPLEAEPYSAGTVTSGARMIEDLNHGSEISHFSEVNHGFVGAASDPVLSAPALDQEPETYSPRIAVDPAMAGGAVSAAQTSFSDINELPPMKEPVFIEPPPPPLPEPEQHLPASVRQIYPRPKAGEEEKPRIQPREVAKKAINEIATIPPRLIMFSTLAAVAVILIVAVAIFLHVHSEDDGSTAAPHPVKSATTPQPAAQQPARAPASAKASPAPIQPLAPPVEAQPNLSVRPTARNRVKTQRAPAPAPVPVVIPGHAFVDSTPQGASFQLDGKGDPSWVTPFDVTGLSPGNHIISVSKNGFTSEIRSVDVVSGGKSSLVVHLVPVNALVIVNSTPAGAEITLDGKVTGRVTPAQFAVEKGPHSVVLKKQGFLDETTTADLGPGQNFQYAPVLKALGNAEEIRTVGKFNKLFGRGGESTAGMGGVSVHTQPKGAQVAINQRVLDKLSPVEIMLGPGNYVVDITLTGFKPVHKVITVERGGKVAIDEILDRN